jgi:hypothetical protein
VRPRRSLVVPRAEDRRPPQGPRWGTHRGSLSPSRSSRGTLTPLVGSRQVPRRPLHGSHEGPLRGIDGCTTGPNEGTSRDRWVHDRSQRTHVEGSTRTLVDPTRTHGVLTVPSSGPHRSFLGSSLGSLRASRWIARRRKRDRASSTRSHLLRIRTLVLAGSNDGNGEGQQHTGRRAGPSDHV